MTDPKPPAKPNSKRRPDRKPAKKPRGPNRFTESEVARAGRVGKAIGADRMELDPERGVISFVFPKPGEPQSDNEVENWLSKQQQRTP
jgi:hypothetical protein